MSYELTATVRDRVGKGAARALRREKKIPAVIYGAKQPPLPIAIDYKEAFLKLHGGGFMSTIATIDVNGEKIRVIPKDYALDPIKDFLIHVDFLRVTKGSMLTVEVPVIFENEEASPGLKRGGVLNIVRHTVELECPADQIPEHIVADLKGLELGDGIHISNISLPEGVKPIITDRDFTIATIATPAGIREDLKGEGAEADGKG
ncbi:MAG: 50S ribosomal protein L25/general stress protein Ctc [Rhizobiales bacterium]|nr:50S ribosomal protein L25/general stress protein Ctc [Hyphomicrobiales bacterium]